MEELSLIEIIEKVMKNDNEALTFIHKKFRYLLFKYANFLCMDIDEIISEFDLILIKIVNADIRDDSKILSYIKTAFKNLPRMEKKQITYNLENKSEILETNIIFNDLIKDLSIDEKKLLTLKFVEQYNFSEISKQYNVTRQAIQQRFKLILKKLQQVV